ncbi:ATP-binding protein [Azospirillum sp. sgz302134]
MWSGQRRGRGTLAVPVLIAAGLLLSAGAFVQMHSASREADHALVERQSIQLRDALKERIDSQALLLRALRAAFSGPVPVTRDGFATAIRPMLPLFPSLEAVAWARRVGVRDVPALEAEMRAAGQPGFTVRNATGTPPTNQPPGDDLFVITMMEPERIGPLDNGLFGAGLEIASLAGRTPLLEHACATGETVATEAVAPLGREDTGRSFILYLPVYRHVADAVDPSRRCADLAGYMGSVFSIDRLLDEVYDRVDPIRGDVYLLDRSAPDGGRVLAALHAGGGLPASLPPSTEAEFGGASAFRHDLSIGGRRWELVMAVPPSPLFARSDFPAWMVLAMGLLLTVGLAGYTRREAQAKRLLQTEARARAAMARALRESEERFRLALRHSRVSVFSQDRNLRYIWMYNPQTGRPAETYIGRDDAELHAPEDAAFLESVKRSVLETGIGAREEVHLTFGGRVQVFDLIVEPLRDDAGLVSGVICAGIDITEGVQIRQALAEAHADAERANQAKTRFLAAASHDLRQPFQAMSLFHHILTAKLTDPKQREVAHKLGEALAAGNTLLNTLLDTSALEAGNVKPRPVVLPVRDITDRLAREFAEQAAGKGLTLRAVPSSAFVRSDPVLLERMVRNLLVNALRYTGSGRILLGCRHRGDRLLIEVWDTGPGIAPDHQQRIFEDFYRCGTDQRDSGGGLGLGLSIVRRTAQILGHRVEVRSRVGKGTVFSIAVPLIGDRHRPVPEDAEPSPAVAPV